MLRLEIFFSPVPYYSATFSKEFCKLEDHFRYKLAEIPMDPAEYQIYFQ